jgi:flagellar basal body P-ring protein FlgI
MAVYFNKRGRRALAALLLPFALAGCGFIGGATPTSYDTMPRLDPVMGKVNHPALEGTIGEIALFTDTSGLIVTGYGLVVGLPGTGTKNMPPAIREKIEEMLFQRQLGSPTAGTADMDPRAILESSTVSAVEVRGYLPPLARKGTPFDVFVTVLPGSSTTSLNRGILWASDLKLLNGIVTKENEEMPMDTGTIASGQGPIFCTPDMEPRTSPAIKRDLRSGMVINGGIVQEDQIIRLQLYAPSDMVTRQIERAVNARWPSRGANYAVAENNTTITLSIPPEYGNNGAAFIEDVLHIYLRQDEAGFSIMKARELVAALSEPNAPHREIAVALQGLGSGIQNEVLRPAYLSQNQNVRFWAARAGAMLMDPDAMVVLQTIAKTEGSKHQLEAIEGISLAGSVNYTADKEMTLQKLLDSKSTAVRIAAYEGLVNMGATNAIRSGAVGRNFILDLAPSEGPPLIYAMRSGQRRIALIGKPIIIPPNTLYISRDRSITVNAIDPTDVPAPAADAGKIMPIGVGGAPTVPIAAQVDAGQNGGQFDRKQSIVLYYRSNLNGKEVTFTVPNSLASVISKLGAMPDPRKNFDPNAKYIGASYQEIIELLGVMTKTDIKAQFVLSEPPKPILSASEILAGGIPDRNPDSFEEVPEQKMPDLNAIPESIPGTLPSTLPSTTPTQPAPKNASLDAYRDVELDPVNNKAMPKLK